MRNKIKFSEEVILNNPVANIQYKFEKDKEYLITGEFLQSIENLKKSSIQEVEKVNWDSYNTPLAEAKNILIHRTGGIGDILFILPYLKSIKTLNPSCKISFCTMEQNTGVVKLSNYIDSILHDPLEYSFVSQNFDRIIIFDKFIEQNPLAEVNNAFDIPESFLDGIKASGFPSNVSKGRIRGSKIHLALAYSASAMVRNISPFLYWDLLKQLNPKLFRISIYVQKYQEKDMDDLTLHLHNFNPNLEVRKIIKSTIDEVINFSIVQDPPHLALGPDSGLINLWGYHNIPVIGLFGPFESHLRLKYYENAIGIDPITNCMFGKNSNGSCFEHKIGSCKLGEFKNEIHSPCIHLITAEHILTGIQFLIKKLYPELLSN